MKTFLSFVFLALACSAAWGQDTMVPHPPKELSQLTWLLGDWESKSQSHSAGPGASTKAPASLSVKKAIKSQYIEIAQLGDAGMMGPFEGRSLITYDVDDKIWRSYWFDSMSYKVMEMTGTLKDHSLIFTSKPIKMTGVPQPMTFRVSYTHKANNRLDFLLEMELSGKWSKAVEGNYSFQGPR